MDCITRALLRWIKTSVAVSALLIATGCGDTGELPNNQKATFAVEPATAMDTTPAGTPAPPSAATLEGDVERTVGVRVADRVVETDPDTVPAGEILFQVTNTGTVVHALRVRAEDVLEETQPIDPGALATLTLRLEPGTYTLACPLDHAGGDRRHGPWSVAELVVRSEAPTLMAPPDGD